MPEPGSTVQLASDDKMIGTLKFSLSRVGEGGRGERGEGGEQGGTSTNLSAEGGMRLKDGKRNHLVCRKHN